MKSLLEQLSCKLQNQKTIFDLDFCEGLDMIDGLKHFRDKFVFPEDNMEQVVYLCGNSLGLLPKTLEEEVLFHIRKWGMQAVEGHFTEPRQWLTIDDTVQSSLANIVGALPHEVVAMNTLTCNLHLMMISFYQPTEEKYKIIIEKKAFSSDFHAVQSQILLHNLSTEKCLVEIAPRDGELLLRMEDIEEVISREGHTTALILFSGVQYYTGQYFDIAKITQLAHKHGCIAGFDLAHAVGNVPLSLHDWDCDFACWCSYKYLNSGPGAIAGCFVHDRYGGRNPEVQEGCNNSSPTITSSSSGGGSDGSDGTDGPCNSHDAVDAATVSNESEEGGVAVEEEVLPRRLQGWWGHRLSDRFHMQPSFRPCHGAYGFRLSNPSVLSVACLRASLDLFDEAGMNQLREKSLLLTAYLEALVDEWLPGNVRIISPRDPTQRGCQLSLCFIANNVGQVQNELKQKGFICDVRKPDVMRVAPTPLYNSFCDVYKFVMTLKSVVSYCF